MKSYTEPSALKKVCVMSLTALHTNLAHASEPELAEQVFQSDYRIYQDGDDQDSNTVGFFLEKMNDFRVKGKSFKWEWMFHGSKTPESTYDIAKANFSMTHLGSYSGNRGCYGEGIYLSTRGYMPMIIAISQEHFMIIAAKVIKGITNIVKHLSVEEYTKGAPICYGFDSNVSEDGIEVVIGDSNQILPSFVIEFTVEGLKNVGTYIWSTPQGDKQLPDIYLGDKRLLSFR